MRKRNNPTERVISKDASDDALDDSGVSTGFGSSRTESGVGRRSGLVLGVGLVTSLLCVLVLVGIAISTGGLVVSLHEEAASGSQPTAIPSSTPAIATRISERVVATSQPAAPVTPTVTATSATPVRVTTLATAISTATAPATPTATVSAAPTVSPTATITIVIDTTQRQLHIFHSLWNIVNDQYIYPDFNGVDWSAARVTTEQRILAGISDEQFYGLMRDLIDSLKDDHSSYLSPDEAHQEANDYSGTGEYVGVGLISDINAAKKYVYVLQVLPKSPAEAAGIHAHDHILSINGQPSVDSNGDANTSLLRGPVGTTVTVTVSAPGGAPHSVVITRANLSTSSPVQYRILPGRKRIGYLLVPTFFEQDMETRVRDALQAMMNDGALDGLIVDMRINGGGSFPVLLANLGFYTHGRVGSLVDRRGVIAPVDVTPDPLGNSQTVSMVVLTGPGTQSYAEVFAGVLQANRRVRLIGQKSAGNIETLHSHRFEDGSVAWIAEETFHLNDGTNWEGKGLAPDIAVNRAWDDYTDDNDPVIAAAVKILSNGR